VVVSTDIGGTDPDDFQSMVHLLVSADQFDLEGLISSPYGPGRKQHILEVLAHYERDVANLQTYSSGYLTPPALRAMSQQGALEGAGWSGFAGATEGSDWIIRCARQPDPRPLWVLVWGGIDDVAQALHDAPDILPRLRVYFIGGPNKMWSVHAYHYIAQHHPTLWLIEANSTYRGWFVGGRQDGVWANDGFAAVALTGRGALGDFFTTQLGGRIKMGDSPSVAYLLRAKPEDPTADGWGGRFVRTWDGRFTAFQRLTTTADQVEAFGVVEFTLPLPEGVTRAAGTRMVFDNRIPALGEVDGRVIRFRFSPRDAKVWPYVIRSAAAALDGQTGAFTAVQASLEKVRQPSLRQPNWWIDDPAPVAAEGVHAGAKSVSRWREEFLRDFALRMERCRAPKP
jgi:hypothetical protein